MSLLSSSNYTNISSVPQNAFNGMFRLNACIKNHPQKPLVFPATTLAEGCYQAMFFSCPGLTCAPDLPAATLADDCYGQMFGGCTGLSSITCLATDISAGACTYGWMSGVSTNGTRTFYKDASMSGWNSGDDSGIPSGWTVANYTEPQP